MEGRPLKYVQKKSFTGVEKEDYLFEIKHYSVGSGLGTLPRPPIRFRRRRGEGPWLLEEKKKGTVKRTRRGR